MDSQKNSCTHILENQVDILVVIGLHHVGQTHDVVVVAQALQENDFSERSLCIGSILEGVIDLLQRYDFLIFLLKSTPNDAISLETS